MKDPYQYALSSPNAFLQFLCDYQYDTLLERSIGASIVNSNVGEENLYNALLAVKDNSPETFATILNFPLAESSANTAQENALVQRVAARSNGPKMRRSLPYFCDSNFTGPLTPEQQEAIDGGACESNSIWNADSTNTALGILGTITTLLGGIFGGGNDNPPPDNTDNPPPVVVDESPDYLPWVFAGVAVLVIVIVAVLLYRKRK